jgi:alkylation response protein AidB-like acyl-CoA dehydrogenase
MPMSVEDSELLRASIRAALARLSGPADVRRAMATARGFDAAVWRRLAGELGLPGLMLPTDLGGGGFTAAELAIVFEEAGAALLCAPLFGTAGLAVPLLQALGDEAALRRWGPAVAAGELTATVALAEDSGRWRADAVAATATEGGSGWVLDGVKNYVVDGASAGLILVVARTGGGLGVFAVTPAAAAAGLGRERLGTLDQTRRQARLTLAGTPAVRVGGGDATAAVGRATAVSRMLLAAEQVGGAQRCLDMTVAYAKTRIQFGRAIGSFQAVKQRLAEGLVQVESARSAAVAAGLAAVSGADEFEHAAAIAALTCGAAYDWMAAAAIQLHGGIGFTWEHDAQLYFKRARASALLLGTAGELLDLIGQQLDVLVS